MKATREDSMTAEQTTTPPQDRIERLADRCNRVPSSVWQLGSRAMGT